MCGIFASVSHTHSPPSADLLRCLCRRGPDRAGTVQRRIDSGAGTLALTFVSTVLSLRGDQVTPQPLVDRSTGSLLCWNGEAWRIRGRPVSGNDGEVMLSTLVEAAALGRDPCHVLDVLRSVEGPFAFVYLDQPSARLFYGRDRLGRRSLLKNGQMPFALSTVADSPAEGWQEVEADGCYVVPLEAQSSARHDRYDWVEDTSLASNSASAITQVSRGCFPLTRQSPSVGSLRHYLLESLRLRILNVPALAGGTAHQARVAVLFSGGLDCTVLARLASDLLPLDQAIDLINVAFENPRVAAQHETDSGPRPNLYELCPDRITGRKSFAELAAVCPDRHWCFVNVNVPFELYTEHRAELIRLIFPHNTEMDMSIASALYFAARASGLAQKSPHAKPGTHEYASAARVLLSGLGADELFGGYTRHATAYARRGYPGLVDELELDVGRLGRRNLGRDDRAMAHWGREVRYPFLDERLVKWAMALQPWDKCDFANQETVDGLEPAKRVLRLLAEDLGMGAVAREKKRAIQFGARTAKMQSGKVKGSALIAT